MAGGMGHPRRGVPLRDRPTFTGPDQDQPITRPGQPGQQRHCYVECPDGRFQGLILQWAQEPHGWVALTIWVKPGPEGDVAIQEWIPAHRLTAAG